MNTMPQEQRFQISGPAGRLEARIRPIAAGRPLKGAALICHPHPLHGGSLNNKILYRIAKRLAEEADVEAMRFNFRGVGRSDGVHDGKGAEIEDARVALSFLADRILALPLVVIGFSFGAFTGLRAAVENERVKALVALGLPLRGSYDHSFLGETGLPRCFVQGEHDFFGDRAGIEEFVANLSGETQLEVIDGADHVFTGFEDEAVATTVNYIRSQLSRS